MEMMKTEDDTHHHRLTLTRCCPYSEAMKQAGGNWGLLHQAHYLCEKKTCLRFIHPKDPFKPQARLLKATLGYGNIFISK